MLEKKNESDKYVSNIFNRENIYSLRKKKNHRDIFIEIRSEQLKNVKMNMMLFFIILILILTLYVLFYVNTDFNIDDIGFELTDRVFFLRQTHDSNANMVHNILSEEINYIVSNDISKELIKWI